MITINKAERLNDMMFYLNDKNSFNLKDIIRKYSISKSTALRDLQSLEEIGMPIYSQSGRNGYYGILPNKLLSPIVFNIDEIFALYFSMLTLKEYETTPFHLSVERLKQKFEKCLSPEKIEMLRKIEKVFSLGTITHNNHCAFLAEILKFAVDEKVCTIKYHKKDTPNLYSIQFFDISSAYGQWYATGYNFETNKTQVFRCDKVLEMKESSQYTPKPFTDFNKNAHSLYKEVDATDYEVAISQKGIDLFHKEHYPSMKLYVEEGHCCIRGFYNKGEEDFISNYFISYGTNILSIQPEELANSIRSKVYLLQSHFISM